MNWHGILEGVLVWCVFTQWLRNRTIQHKIDLIAVRIWLIENPEKRFE